MFHKVLKSGCQAEASKLRTAERLANLMAVFSILSWRVLSLGSPRASGLFHPRICRETRCRLHSQLGLLYSSDVRSIHATSVLGRASSARRPDRAAAQSRASLQHRADDANRSYPPCPNRQGACADALGTRAVVVEESAQGLQNLLARVSQFPDQIIDADQTAILSRPATFAARKALSA